MNTNNQHNETLAKIQITMIRSNVYSSENWGNISHIFKYCNDPKISDTRKFAVITLKVEQDGFSLMHPNDAEGIANSVDPDQTAPLGAVWSGSVLFAQTCRSENLGT